MVNITAEQESDLLITPYQQPYRVPDDLTHDNWIGLTTTLDPVALPSGFERAVAYFGDNRDEIQKAFSGKFVAIWEDTILDSDEDFSELANRVYGQYGYLPIYMPFVGRKLKLQFPSPILKQPKRNEP